MKPNKRYGLLHFIIFLWGCTPILGKLIQVSSLRLVFWRLIFASLSLFVFVRWKGISLRFQSKPFTAVFATGLLVGIHWYTFYEAIKISNVTACMVGFSTITLFASILQPLILKKPFYISDIVYGLVLMAAIIFLIHRNGVIMMDGILMGMVSAFFGALFSVINGRLAIHHHPVSLTLVEFIGAFVFMAVIRLIIPDSGAYWEIPGQSDLIYLLILSVVCTGLAFTLSIEVLRDFDPLTIILTNNLEIVYGLVFSFLLFRQSEQLHSDSYVAIAFILLSVFTYPLVKPKFTH